ncbi:4-(cytidine 5'-diphospho)-2-C-methyl-D-erythritol kinase [Elioraea sp.]|uniref:4-(cytidine 5'-diphospho)-2-C-methyl-D-erythritol kinase n=1 Tax=Elioraea sp. TaxID=2185103 RepID=UPI003F71EFF8
MTVTETAQAKVNLFLHVLGRRGDGYHELDSLVVFAAAADTLRAEPAEVLSLAVDGPFGAALAGVDNLVLRAARRLAAAAATTKGARLTLTKALPVASGIGGGSADAAAALRALDRLWRLGLGVERLAAIGVALGADIPVCVHARPARMGGIGECVVAAPALPRFGLLLANPGVGLATAAVFAARAGGFDAPAVLPASWPDAAAMARDLAACRNALEPAAIALCPPIAEVLAAIRALPGARLARLSGSGATCFALFDDDGAATRAAALLGTAHPSWWVAAGLAATPGCRAGSPAPAVAATGEADPPV